MYPLHYVASSSTPSHSSPPKLINPRLRQTPPLPRHNARHQIITQSDPITADFDLTLGFLEFLPGDHDGGAGFRDEIVGE